jgi:DnaJ-class molecular chaperone
MHEAGSPASSASDAVKPHPLGVCKACGAITYRKEAVGQRCIRIRRGTRCNGIVAVAMRDACWKLCTSCHGTGKKNAALCTYCRGIGWNLAKPWSL